MVNLLKETEQILNKHGKTLDDIVWIGCEDFKIPINTFIDVANRCYDDGYGAKMVAVDLLVVGDAWWLERHDYDGAEWWEYKELPKEPELIEDVFTVISNPISEEIRFSGVDGSDYEGDLKNMRRRLLPDE